MIEYSPAMTSPATRGWLAVAALLLAACGDGGSSGAGAGGRDGGGSGGGSGGVDAGASAGTTGAAGTGAGGRAGTGGQPGAGGRGGTSAGDATAPFTGTWTFSAGTVTPMCGAINVPPISLAGSTATITRVDATHVTMSFATTQLTCNLNLTVSGSTATAASGQTCMITVMGVAATVTVTSWTLMASGSTLAMSMRGTARAGAVTCMPSGSGTLMRTP
jgi:hypothetical protein